MFFYNPWFTFIPDDLLLRLFILPRLATHVANDTVAQPKKNKKSVRPRAAKKKSSTRRKPARLRKS